MGMFDGEYPRWKEPGDRDYWKKIMVKFMSINKYFLIVWHLPASQKAGLKNTVKPVCNDHLDNKIYCLWFIQQCVLMKTAGTNLLLLTISAFWSSSRWAPEGREVSH